MHTLIWRTSRSSPRTSISRSCRFIAGRRHPLGTRNFHRSAVAYRHPHEPEGTTGPAWPAGTPVTDGSAFSPEASDRAAEIAEGTEAADLSTEKLQSAKDKNNYGSAARRAGRNVPKPKAPPPVTIPEWFLKKNILLRKELRETPGLLDRLTINRGSSVSSKQIWHAQSGNDISPGEKSTSVEPPVSSKSSSRCEKYQIQQDIWLEIRAHVAAGLQLPSARYANSFPATKTHLVLHCPEEGGIFFLDAVVESIASDIGADLLCLDPQDIAELGGEYLGDISDTGPYTLRSLGYDAHRVVSRQDGREMDNFGEEDEEFDDEQEEAHGDS